MKIYAINGSPRKNKNTATLLEHALAGAKEAYLTAGHSEIETKLIHLYDYTFTGCKSCFACKRLGLPTYGTCAPSDQIHDLLREITDQADVLIFGSPIYWDHVSAQLLAFLERLLFPLVRYAVPDMYLFKRPISIGSIYTMNANMEWFQKKNYQAVVDNFSDPLRSVFSTDPHNLVVMDTKQFDDYSKYDASIFNPLYKEQQYQKQFPLDCKNAFTMGRDLVREFIDKSKL